jgi:HAMP domain-containing protein
MQRILLWTRGSIYRVILGAFIVVSISPLILISFLFIRDSMDALIAQMEANLQQLAVAKAEEINLRLSEVKHSTEIAALEAGRILQMPLNVAEIEGKMSRYQPDGRNILGLDIYYQAQGGEAALGTDLSNVYWTSWQSNDPVIRQQIAQTEALDPIFSAIKQVSEETQWIYLTTSDGMMRLYPWASNDHYPDSWDPREIIFYSVAAPENNPTFQTRWTPPYVDFAGAGWMVTVSTPVVDQSGDFLGVMSHDITIDSLQEIALSINVLDGSGYGFLIQNDGNVITHPAIDAAAVQGAQGNVNLASTGSTEFRTLIRNMMAGESGSGYYDEGNQSYLLVFAPIPEIGWSIGVTVPRSEVVAPAMAMRNRAIFISVVLAVVVVAVAAVLARVIHNPLVQLLEGVQRVAKNEKVDEIKTESFSEIDRLAEAFNDMAAQVWAREARLKAHVAEMKIEIDAHQKKQRLESIVETDFFKRLELNVSRLREDIKRANIANSPTGSMD